MIISTARRLSPIALCLALMIACQTHSPHEEQANKEESSSDSNTVLTAAVLPPTVPLKYLMGQFEPSQDSNFVKIAPQYTNKSNIYLHKETYAAFLEMSEAAKRDSIHLRILSATRNFDSQKSIWEAKWNGQRKLSDGTNAAEITNQDTRALRILEYSSMPGTSRHHWGTDIDLNSLNNAFFEKEPGLKIYNWLTANAARFGFCQPYSPKGPNRLDGYNEEKWHWSYLPLAKQYQASARQLMNNDRIQGFSGAEVAPSLKVVEKYIFGINPVCLGE